MTSSALDQFPAKEKAMEAKEALAKVKAIENARRKRTSEGYALMHQMADRLLGELESDQSAEAWAIRCRVYYEVHMGAYQRWKDDPAHPPALLDESLLLAQRSAHAGEEGNDSVGRLNAEMNISGNIFPALGMWRSGLEMSRRVSDEAEAEAMHAGDDEAARDRALQVAMNCYVHRIRMHVANNGDREDVEQLMAACEANRVFQRFKVQGAEWVERDMGAARAFVES